MNAPDRTRGKVGTTALVLSIVGGFVFPLSVALAVLFSRSSEAIMACVGVGCLTVLSPLILAISAFLRDEGRDYAVGALSACAMTAGLAILSAFFAYRLAKHH